MQFVLLKPGEVVQGSGSISSSFFNVKDFGATGDGTTDDTVAISLAISAAETAGSGIVYMPAGRFVIRPRELGDRYALLINGDNIQLRGAGRLLTKLVFQLYDGSSPETNWTVVDDEVIRGHGVIVQYKVDGTRENVSFVDFSLDGGAPPTGDYTFPANVDTGDGWDLTHQGIRLQADRLYNNIYVERCDIFNWRGEIISYGGVGLATMRIAECKLHHTNANGISVTSSEFVFEYNEVYECVANGVENASSTGRQIYRHNFFHDIERFAISPEPALDVGPWAATEICFNWFERCNQSYSYSTLALNGAKGVKVLDNTFRDCKGPSILANSMSTGGSGIAEILQDSLIIAGNRFICDQSNAMTYGIQLFTSGDYEFINLIVKDNTAYRTEYAIGEGNNINACVGYGTSGVINLGWGCHIENNHTYRGISDDTSQVNIGPYTLPDTSITNLSAIAQKRYVPMMRIKVRVVVENDPTDVDVIAYTFTGEWSGEEILSVNALPVGAHSYTHYMPVGGGDGFSMNLTAQASIANNVTVTTEIDGF